MRVLACLTYTDILEHLVTHFREQRRLFDDTLVDLGIGTYQPNLVTVQQDETLGAALDLMRQHNLSALPVLAGDKIVAVYSRSDITFLTKATDAEDAVSNLNLPLDQVLDTSIVTPDALRTCSPQHTLQAIFESFAQFRFHRLYVVNEQDQLLGVVSAKDLVAYFLQDENNNLQQ
jgi:CBS domain-containing protein